MSSVAVPLIFVKSMLLNMILNKIEDLIKALLDLPITTNKPSSKAPLVSNHGSSVGSFAGDDNTLDLPLGFAISDAEHVASFPSHGPDPNTLASCSRGTSTCPPKHEIEAMWIQSQGCRTS